MHVHSEADSTMSARTSEDDREFIVDGNDIQSVAGASQMDFNFEDFFDFEYFNEDRAPDKGEVVNSTEEATETRSISNVTPDSSSRDSTTSRWSSWLPANTGSPKQPPSTQKAALKAISDVSVFAPMPWYSLEGATVPYLLTPDFIKIADSHYSDGWVCEQKYQVDILTNCMLATPGMISLRQCKADARNLWAELYRRKILDLQGLFPGLQYKPIHESTRDHFLTVLAIIHRTRSSPNRYNTVAEISTYRMRFHLELLRWEADEMKSFSEVCDRYRKHHIQQSGVAWRIIDGSFFDLYNDAQFQLPSPVAAHS